MNYEYFITLKNSDAVRTCQNTLISAEKILPLVTNVMDVCRQYPAVINYNHTYVHETEVMTLMQA
jgi:hypothetical protein